VSFCESDRGKTAPAVTFHQLPSKPVERGECISALGMGQYLLNENSLVCFKHFHPSAFETNPHGVSKLKKYVAHLIIPITSETSTLAPGDKLQASLQSAGVGAKVAGGKAAVGAEIDQWFMISNKNCGNRTFTTEA